MRSGYQFGPAFPRTVGGKWRRPLQNELCEAIARRMDTLYEQRNLDRYDRARLLYMYGLLKSGDLFRADVDAELRDVELRYARKPAP